MSKNQKFTGFTPLPKPVEPTPVQPKGSVYDELYLAMDEYLTGDGDSFICHLGDAAIDAVRTASMNYAREQGYRLTTTKLDNKELQLQRIDDNAPPAKRKDWSAYIDEAECLHVDGHEMYFPTTEPDLLRGAFLKRNESIKRFRNHYRFRTRVSEDGVYVRKEKI